ncbi:hypothetical protein N44_04316 [Microcystis aeruginosa NIES-44]|uniref:Uncharacterized protein n=1 Tax=Microcystis aeruginosa NIES-44 TaxID=449439 RepID=A0A0A1W1T5_MICAE|nr:hypothetical protein N44_04316 [Microcystis aeruginosa NIES-44]
MRVGVLGSWGFGVLVEITLSPHSPISPFPHFPTPHLLTLNRFFDFIYVY